MIMPYARTLNYDELMEILFLEMHSHQNLPLINQIKKEGEYPYRVLISTVLSSRTKDEVTAQASEKLFSRAPNAQKLSQLPEQEIISLIYPVGFYRIKAKNIKNIANILCQEYKGIVPNKLGDLLQLPGVGRKTANLVLSVAFKIKAITVDTHVHRISNRIGIVKTKKPAETEQDLQIVLPKKYWISSNACLVAHGQVICKPISPFCSQCNIFRYCQRIGVDKKR